MNWSLAAASLMGVIAIGLGAFGAHGLKSTLAAIPEANAWWNTATNYLIIHAVAVAAVANSSASRLFFLARLCWISGALIFSFTLYAISLGLPRWIGAITPIGGSLMIVGWLLLFWSARKAN